MIQDLAELMRSGPGPGDSLKQALKIFESLGDLRSEATAKANLGFLCAVAGRWDEAVPWLQSAQEQFSRIGDVVRSTDPAMNLGEILVKQRRYDEAEAVLKDAIRVFNSAHFTEGANLAEMQLARVMIERGDHAEAEAILARVQHEFAIAGQRLYALQTAAMRAFGKWSAGFPAEGIALLNAAEAEAGNEADLVRPVVACERARLAATLGDFDTAAREIETGLIAARAQGLPYEEATLLLLQSTLDEVPGTVDRLQAAKASQEILIRLGVLRQSEGHRF
jgi:tetratricopeptide (TPR) repeat protein